MVSPPPSGPGSGAIGIIELVGDIDAAFAAMSINPLAAGAVALRRWSGVDDLVVARFAPASAMLFPHAGSAVLARVHAALLHAGLSAHRDIDVRRTYPEAASLHEARMLDALSRAASPLAIDVLLDQPRRWAAAEHDAALKLTSDESAQLRRLITPPLVIAVGPPNIGKSSLLNALAGRAVSIVADEPGTTRDHVGVRIEVAGLVIRYIDAPGFDTDSDATTILGEAQSLARATLAHADLVLSCGDALSPPLALTDSLRTLRVALRSDLGPAEGPFDVQTSAKTAEGLQRLSVLIRDTLVPPEVLGKTLAWKFWDD